jgi:hypothetical protein
MTLDDKQPTASVEFGHAGWQSDALAMALSHLPPPRQGTTLDPLFLRDLGPRLARWRVDQAIAQHPRLERRGRDRPRLGGVRSGRRRQDRRADHRAGRRALLRGRHGPAPRGDHAAEAGRVARGQAPDLLQGEGAHGVEASWTSTHSAPFATAGRTPRSPPSSASSTCAGSSGFARTPAGSCRTRRWSSSRQR